MNLDTYCPKCNSTNVDIKLKHPLPEPKRISMDDLPKGITPNAIPAIMIYKDYVATCRNCGYKVEWTE